MGSARARGAAGEALAAVFLELIGCRVVARNPRVGGVEVDLIVSDGAARVLVEVKLRGRSDYGGAALAVDHVKQARLLRAARALAVEGPGPVRIDVLAIELTGEGATLRHYRNAVTE